MKKPKSKLEKAKSKFLDKLGSILFDTNLALASEELNNLLNLAKLEAIKKVESSIKKLITEEKD